MEQTQKDFIEQTRPGEARSLYGDMIRSRDFGDQRYFPDALAIRAIGNYWKDQLQNPERSPRARKEIDTLLGRITFELVGRQNDIVATSMAELDNELVQ
jgi:hypothetical protein